MNDNKELVKADDDFPVPLPPDEGDREFKKSIGKTAEAVGDGLGKGLAAAGKGAGDGLAAVGRGFGELEASWGQAIVIRASQPGYIRYLESLERQGDQQLKIEALRVAAFFEDLHEQSNTRDPALAALRKATEEGDPSKICECLKHAAEIIKSTQSHPELVTSIPSPPRIEPPPVPFQPQRKSLLEMGENDDSGL